MIEEARQLVERLEEISAIVSERRVGGKTHQLRNLVPDAVTQARRLYMLLAMDDDDEFAALDAEYMQMHHDWLDEQAERHRVGIPDELRTHN